MEKIKITHEQEADLKGYKTRGYTLEQFKEYRETWNKVYAPLKNFTLDEFARLLYQPDSYEVEVEVEWNIGDCAKYWNVLEKEWLYGVIKHVSIRAVDLDVGGNVNVISFDRLKSCTPAEFKEEQERRLWKSIGREVGEFREGDIRVPFTGHPYIVTDVGNAQRNHERWGTRTFYPVESAISFGGDSE